MAEENAAPQMHPSFIGVIRQKERVKEKLSRVKHKIGVYSAKGGVGKTTIAVNLAYALSKKGFKVGLLDADIDTPNVSLFTGTTEKMGQTLPLKPIEREGVKIASTAMIMASEEKPIIWRGPMMVKMLGEFFENTEWGDLDYLILDLPPGSADAPLTIMQVLQLDGFVIVTTPQRIAAINSIRSGLMAKRLNVALLGVVENMSSGKVSKNTEDVANSLGTSIIGLIKLDEKFNSYSDSGKIPVLEDSEIMKSFESIVETLPKG